MNRTKLQKVRQGESKGRTTCVTLKAHPNKFRSRWLHRFALSHPDPSRPTKTLTKQQSETCIAPHLRIQNLRGPLKTQRQSKAKLCIDPYFRIHNVRDRSFASEHSTTRKLLHTFYLRKTLARKHTLRSPSLRLLAHNIFFGYKRCASLR